MTAWLNQVRTIAPRRSNPGRKAWLPVLRTQHGERCYTALFSNTARAHELYRTHDWGALKGRRLVRGREGECLAYYRQRGVKVPVQGGEPEFTEA